MDSEIQAAPSIMQEDESPLRRAAARNRERRRQRWWESFRALAGGEEASGGMVAALDLLASFADDDFPSPSAAPIVSSEDFEQLFAVLRNNVSASVFVILLEGFDATDYSFMASTERVAAAVQGSPFSDDRVAVVDPTHGVVCTVAKSDGNVDDGILWVAVLKKGPHGSWKELL